MYVDLDQHFVDLSIEEARSLRKFVDDVLEGVFDPENPLWELWIDSLGEPPRHYSSSEAGVVCSRVPYRPRKGRRRRAFKRPR